MWRGITGPVLAASGGKRLMALIISLGGCNSIPKCFITAFIHRKCFMVPGMCIVYTQVEEPILLLSHYLWRKYRQSTW
ncbi:hypothetical protein LINPERHAP2_LOCUS16047 [Linum perenne]